MYCCKHTGPSPPLVNLASCLCFVGYMAAGSLPSKCWEMPFHLLLCPPALPGHGCPPLPPQGLNLFLPHCLTPSFVPAPWPHPFPPLCSSVPPLKGWHMPQIPSPFLSFDKQLLKFCLLQEERVAQRRGTSSHPMSSKPLSSLLHEKACQLMRWKTSILVS